MSDVQCQDLIGDRGLGAYWERELCREMARRGKAFTPLQIGRDNSAEWFRHNGEKWNRFTLPDVVIWTNPGEHHEIKHKTTNKYGKYGLEKYRFEALVAFALETKQPVMYSIHDHHGDRQNKQNNLSDWVTADVLNLHGADFQQYWGNSWVGGEKKRVPILYWKAELWQPLFI